MTPLDDLFSPQRLRGSWGDATPAPAPRGAPRPPSSRGAKELDALAAAARALSGPGSRALQSMVEQLGELLAAAGSGAAPPEALDLLDRIEDLADAVELSGTPQR